MAIVYKQELINRVCKKIYYDREVIQEILDEALMVITVALKDGEEVRVPDFGTFYTRVHEGGTIRDMQTGKDRKYPKGRRVGFRVSSLVKDLVKGR